ncbi:hypothetical protein [Sphingomonas fuzhouensis]|uniref:hypothetical protein n=1 Tax=Sphingomonas fuzhouensis TaxID=3106033 RepID=UPI002AFE4DA6|nr:hypothetical protein [Sphingomonas sp. SGZ-02]
MSNSLVDVRRSRKPFAMVAGLAVLAGIGAFLMRNHGPADGTSSNDRIVVVSARGQDMPHRERPEADPAKPLPAILDAAGVDRMVSQYLPMLRAVRSECDADICVVSAQPNAAGAPLDDLAFSQLVQQDMPTILTRAGHGLTEPIQIEELGPDQYRLRFRIARQAH